MPNSHLTDIPGPDRRPVTDEEQDACEYERLWAAQDDAEQADLEEQAERGGVRRVVVRRKGGLR